MSGWNEFRIERLRRMWAAGATAQAIAVELGDGITRNAVVGKAHRLGLPERPSPIHRNGGAVSKPKAPPRQHEPNWKAQLNGIQGARATHGPNSKKARERTAAPLSTPGMASPALKPPRAITKTCLWLEGERLPFQTCDAAAEPGRPYCSDHCAKAYKKKTSANDDAPAAIAAPPGRITASLSRPVPESSYSAPARFSGRGRLAS